MNRAHTGGSAPSRSDATPVQVEFAEAAKRIEANPLGRLMYGQRELFHSNLIGWFFDELPDVADAVFRPLAVAGEGADRRVDRELQHLDLVMHWPDRAPLVIENKVFSIPARDQLDSYETVSGKWDVKPSLMLLSLSAPNFDLGAWTYLNYMSLATRILDELPTSNNYEVETMRRYAALVLDLHELVSAVEVRELSEPVWLPQEQLAHVGSSQMRAALNKARAQRVAGVISQSIQGPQQLVNSGLTNSAPFVESFERVRAAGIEVDLGWQLQSGQFRRAVRYYDKSILGHTSESRRRREDASRARPHFFAFPSQLPQLRGGRKDFNHFAPNFVYRYVKTPSITVAQLVDAARSVHAEIESLRGAEPMNAGPPGQAEPKNP